MSTSPTPAQTSSKRRLKKWLLILGILATSLAWGLFLRGQLAKLREFEWQLFSWQNGLGILLGGTYFAGLSFIWVMLVRQMLGMERPLPYRSGMSLWLSTMITRYIPGNIWHIVGRLAGANQFGIPKTVIISSSTIEQVLTLVGSLGLGLLALPLWLSSEGITRGVSIVLLYIFLLPACLSALHPKVLGRFLSWLSVRIRRPEVKWNYQYGQILGMSGLYFLTSAVAGLALGAVLWGIEGIHMRDLPMVLGGRLSELLHAEWTGR
jgi:hypothetical protein